MKTKNTSLLHGEKNQEHGGSRHSLRLVQVSMERLVPHPANANVMDEERLDKLQRNIQREGDYPPLIVRPLDDGTFQILDGHQRVQVLRSLGNTEAVCYLWPCDDEAALILLATLNRLEGDDDPARRAELIDRLLESFVIDELGDLLPESQSLIQDTLELIDLDMDSLRSELERAAESTGPGVRAIAFAVDNEQESVIEDAVALASQHLEGQNKRGRALALICESYLKGSDDDG